MNICSRIVSSVLFIVPLFAAPADAQTVQLVSVDSFGVQGNSDSRAPRISADGRWVVLKSYATNLVPGDTNATGDVFLRDLQTGTTSIVSVGMAGTQANNESFSPSISADGSVIAFHSLATNLVPSDTNNKYDVFVRKNGTITKVSNGIAGQPANNDSVNPIVSGDGRYVLFESIASNLISTDSNGTWDVFRFDTLTNTLIRVSLTSTGAQANGESVGGWLDQSGRYVAFASLATNLVSGDTNGSSDVFLRDVVAGQTISATVWSNFTANGGSDSAVISSDGQLITFRSSATNLVPGDTNGKADIFVGDPWNQSIFRVSVPFNGGQANGDSDSPHISPDGLYVVFTSSASNLISGDGNIFDDIFMRDLTAGTTVRISGDSYGFDGDGHSRAASVANGGKKVVFKSDADNLVPGDNNLNGDVFLRAPAPMTWYVDDNAAPPGNGSPQFPYQDLQYALANSFTNDGDTILVRPGTYLGGFDFVGKDLQVKSTAGADVTILDGQNFVTVVSIKNGEGPTTLLEGFTLQNGVANSTDAFGFYVGGGLNVQGASPTVRNCKFLACNADIGGGMYLDGPVVQIENCEFRNCPYGGGLSVQNAVGQVVDSTFEDNATQYGYPASGGARFLSSSVSVLTCTIRTNTSYYSGSGPGLAFLNCSGVIVDGCESSNNFGGDGAGIWTESSTVEIRNSQVHDNYAYDEEGGGLYLESSSTTIRNCLIRSNRADYSGGGIYALLGDLTIEDCDISDCVAGLFSQSTGGGVFAQTSSPAFITRSTICRNRVVNVFSSSSGAVDGWSSVDSCTIVGNVGDCGSFSGNTTLKNTIVWGNVQPTLCGPLAASFCDLESGPVGPGSLQIDPLFWNQSAGDYHLRPGSPCINTGDPLSPLDPDGTRIEMGAIPFDPNYCGEPVAYCTGKTNSQGCVPSISWMGTPSLTGTADDFHITGSNFLSNKSGLMFWGVNPAALPFQGGTLCVQPPIIRTGSSNSGGNPPPVDCSGHYDYHLTQAYMASHLFQVGTTIYAQYWARDPGFQPPNNTSLSNGLRIVLCP